MLLSYVYLWIFGSFSENLFNRAPLRNCFSQVQVAVFQSADAVKNRYFTGIFQVFIAEREVAIRWPSFTENPWKLYVERLIRNEIARCQPATLCQKLLHISSFMYFTFIFYECITILPKRLRKCASKDYSRKYKQKVVSLVIYLFNYYSSKITSFILNVAFGFTLITVFVK